MTQHESNAKSTLSPLMKSAFERARNGSLELQGATLEFFGRKFIALDGKLGALNAINGEVRGQVRIVSTTRPSVLSGAVKLRVQGLEFELSMICVRDADAGELLVKFLGRYVPRALVREIQA
jgi:hypothetical protein